MSELVTEVTTEVTTEVATEVATKTSVEKMELTSEKTGDEVKGLKDFLKEEDGMGTVEIILIIVVLVGLVLIFKDQITKVVNNIFGKISSESAKV